MNENETDREVLRPGRRIHVLVFGDNASEIELAALDAAREFFGDSPRLRVVPDYLVHDVRPGSPLEAARTSRKTWQADITVEAQEG